MIGIVLVLASLLSVGGQLCQKQATRPLTTGGRRRHLMLWLGLALICMGAAMVLWLLVLQPCRWDCLPDVESVFCLGHAGSLENLA